MRNLLLWSVAILLTITSAVWQKKSGPTYPIGFSEEIAGVVVEGKLPRSNSINSDLPVMIQVAERGQENPGVGGTVFMRNFPTQDHWEYKALVYNQESGQLEGGFNRPHMAAKVEYYVDLTKDGQTLRLPVDESAVSRFKGDVPQIVLIIHIFCMFFGMLWSTRAGFEAIFAGPSLHKQTRVAFLLLLVGGMILGPVVQKYAFDAYWTGWPLGEDLTDNKLGLAVVLWGLATFMTRRTTSEKPVGRWWAVAAMLVILVVFSIPHSIHGSTFDYETGEHIQVWAQTSWLRVG